MKEKNTVLDEQEPIVDYLLTNHYKKVLVLLILVVLSSVFLMGYQMGVYFGSEALPCVSPYDTYELWGFT